ncbi:MAG: DEAD/DEAH box helicase [Planctomycetes bacterium]|nr:DEAD/DEAH box helicase [Planctomycetota bacterium]
MSTSVKTSKKRELTLKDRLSRLTYLQACKLLGAEGERLIRHGGGTEIDIDEDVYFGGDLFRLRLNGAVVTITQMAEAKQRLHWNCTACDGACEHVGAAFSLILEEKMALGLAAPPPERIPVESLSEQELVEQAIAQREERARKERMTVRAMEPNKLWTDYMVTSSESGKTYRVALRGWQPGESYCSCPDFRKNTLGVCKHILNVQRKTKRRFSAATCKHRYRRRRITIHLCYAHELELRMLLPDNFDDGIGRIVRPIRNRAIQDVHDLLKRVGKLEALGHDVMIYPDAEEYISRRLFQDRIASVVADIQRDPKQHPLRTQLLKGELLPYQLDGIAFAVGAGRAILADDMGLGKTIQGIGIAELLAREASIKRVLIVCPASVKSQWRSEIQRFSNRDCQLVLGSAAERAEQYDSECFFTICNYEQVLRDIIAIEKVSWDLIILDEGQRIKNWEAKTSRVIKGLKSPYALVLSGTPLENRLDDLFSVAEFIDDQRLGPAFRFFNRHRIVDEKGKVLGYKNLGDLRKRLQPILLRRTRALVMQDLPPRTTEIMRIAPTEEQADLHGANLRIVSSIVRKPYINEMDLLRLRKALLMCRMSADSTFLVDKQEPGYSSKLEALDDLLGSLLAEEDRKIILFSEWTTMLGLIEPLIEKRGAPYVRLDGSVPQKRRQQLVQTFQKDPNCRLFIATNAGATGLNLQAANTVINVDLPWNPAVLEQRVARAHRMGQKRPVQVFVLVTERTIEENLLATLSAKHELALAALDAESEIDTVDLASGIEELKARLEVLLGAKPDAPIDESEKTRQADEAERLARREKVALAGGQLVTAAFAMLNELIPSREPTEASDRFAENIKERLSECFSKDEQGRPQLTLTLPDSTALDSLLGALARLMEVPNGLAGQPTVVMKSKRVSTIPLSDGLSQTHTARVGAGEQV